MATSMIPGSVAPTVPSQANPEVAQKTTRSLRRGWLWLRRVLFSGLLLGGDTMTGFEIALRSGILLFAFAMSILLSQRSARLDREQGRLRQEMAAAGEVQRLLLAGQSSPA